uniref:Uncharacterized protein n=1 Tax=Knipowitschia caucasica TaxID=637954 RepID=A0AAV2JLM0_KNICA
MSADPGLGMPHLVYTSIASEEELRWVIRTSVVLFGLAGTSLTFLHTGVMAFWVLGGKITYILMFPQLVCVLFIRCTNGLLCGEPMLALPPVLHFPGCALEGGVCVQYWPIRSTCMLLVLATIPLVSRGMAALFNRELLSQSWDVFKVWLCWCEWLVVLVCCGCIGVEWLCDWLVWCGCVVVVVLVGVVVLVWFGCVIGWCGVGGIGWWCVEVWLCWCDWLVVLVCCGFIGVVWLCDWLVWCGCVGVIGWLLWLCWLVWLYWCGVVV